jgi:hypothetical protein
MALLLIRTATGESPTGFRPYWSDEISYWHQTLTFINTGFAGGYYTYHELPPAASFSHYYTYGPWYAILYGLPALLVGWHLYTSLILNIALVCIGLILFAVTLHLRGWRLLLTALLIGSFWPFQLYVLSGMVESVHYFIAMIAALIFYRLLRAESPIPLGWKALAFAFLFGAAVLRISWGILFVPFFFLSGRKSLVGAVVALAASIVAIFIVFVFMQYIGAPGNNSIVMVTAKFRVSVADGLKAFYDYFGDNLGKYLNLGKRPVDALQTVQVVALILGSALTVSVLLFRFVRGRTVTLSALSEAAFHLFNLGGVVLASLALYIIGTMGDYRVISAHLLLSLLLLVACKRAIPAALVVVTSLLMAGAFWTQFKIYITPKFPTNLSSEVIQFEDSLRKQIVYQSDAPNGWCNTLLFQTRNYTSFLNAIPAGIGLSFFPFAGDSSLTFKSRYLLFSEADMQALQRNPHAPPLQLLATGPSANLYLNLNASCGAT